MDTLRNPKAFSPPTLRSTKESMPLSEEGTTIGDGTEYLRRSTPDSVDFEIVSKTTPPTPTVGTPASPIPRHNSIDFRERRPGDDVVELWSHKLAGMDYGFGRTQSRVISVNDIYRGFEGVCGAYVEFERHSPTMHPNSAALILSRKLTSEDLQNLLPQLTSFSNSLSALRSSSPSTRIDFYQDPSRLNTQTILDSIQAIGPSYRGLCLELDNIAGKAYVSECVRHIAHACGEIPRPVSELYLDNIFQAVSRASATAFHASSEYRKAFRSAGRDDVETYHGIEETYKFDATLQNLEEDIIINTVALLDEMTRKLQSRAVKQGLKSLLEKQEHSRKTFMDFTTVAIFFSSIAATTLQFSYSNTNSSASWHIVNLCWFASVVLSIASATNSLLGVVVHQSPEHLLRSPRLDHRVLQVWFKYCPPILLTVSGVMFLMGICSFTFSSSQGRFIQITTTSLLSSNLVALIGMSLLAFTRIIHVLARPIMAAVCFVYPALEGVITRISRTARVAIACTPHLAVLFPLVVPVLIALPFVVLSYRIYQRRLPQGYEYVFWGLESLGLPGRFVFAIFVQRWIELKRCFEGAIAIKTQTRCAVEAVSSKTNSSTQTQEI